VSVVRTPAIAEFIGTSGLSDDESNAVHDEAYRLMVDGRSLGVGAEEYEDGLKFVFVLDIQGNRYLVVRDVGAYLLVDPALGIIAESGEFDQVLQELKNSI
jgi:hypothetical protein